MSTVRLASSFSFIAVSLIAASATIIGSGGTAAAQDAEPEQPVMQLQPPAQQPNEPPPGYGQTYPQPQPQPQYGYGQPVPQQPQPDPARGWRSGDPVPPGYRIDTRPNWALVGVGIGLLAGGWLVSSMIGYTMIESGDDNGYKLLIPIAGPLLLMQDTEGPLAGLADAFLLFDALVQTAGGVLLTLGIVLQRERLVADPNAGVQAGITPYVGPTGAGILGRF